jgi:hypothetical protein
LNNILIIGTGNIGLRHLESISKSKKKLNIFIYDLLYSKQINELVVKINKYKNKVCVTKLNNLNIKHKIDVCIIATNSKERYKVSSLVIRKVQIKNIIFEKIAFQTTKAFKSIINISQKKKINLYVNCPRRTYKIFKDIKKKIKNINGKLSLSYSGSKWGLCSNSIHFFDLLFFFTKFDNKYIVNDKLKNQVIVSKRNGYFELQGLLEISSKNYYFHVKDDEKINQNSLTISKGNIFFEIKYDNIKKCFVLKSNTFRPKKISIPLQSDLTLNQINMLIDNKNCELTKIEDSIKYHEVLIKVFLKKFNKIFKKKIYNCPIT